MYLGIELGSTRIKAVGIDQKHQIVRQGDYNWKSDFIDGIWTYSLDEAFKGLNEALLPFKGEKIDRMGVSAMMHGYLAFDKDWNLLVPFRTWQNTCTAQAAEELSKRFNFNIPQRWSIAHLYQAILNNESHVPQIAHITTLAGYIHYSLTGVNAMGVGEASGMFPIDAKTGNYNEEMLNAFDELLKQHSCSFEIRQLLPKVLKCGEEAGTLTEKGYRLLNGAIAQGTPFVPCEGDAGTGMVATNAVKQRTGNVSAGTSIFSMVVLEQPLKKVYPEIDVVSTPDGKDVAMVHCNNCTNDSNVYVSLFNEVLKLFGTEVNIGDLYTKLYNKSLEGAKDCDHIITCNYMAGEGVTHMDEGRPFVIRKPDSQLTLANLMRSQLYATMSTLKIGMDILREEGVKIDSLTGHGGLFKTPKVAQSYLAAACHSAITCMESAGEGGPYGMALLAMYGDYKGMSLSDYLDKVIFADCKKITMAPTQEDMDGFDAYLKDYKRILEIERTAVDKF